MTELPARWRLPVLGVTVLAVLAAVTIALRADIDPAPPAVASPAPTSPGPTSPGPTSLAPIALRPPLRVWLGPADFAREHEWFAVRAECETGQLPRCRKHLLASRDGRAVERELPGDLRETRDGQEITVTALGPGRVALTDPRGPRYFSADSGATWSTVTGSDPAVEAVPAGAVLEPSCAEGTGCPVPLSVTVPATGRRAALRTPPPLRDPRPAPRPGPDGRLWVAGLGERDLPAMAVSADGGRSWQVGDLGVGPARGWYQVRVVPTAGLTHVLLSHFSPAADQTPEPARLLRSADGRRWERLWQAKPDRPGPDDPLALVVARGRISLVDRSNGVWVSADGRAFRPARAEERVPGGGHRQVPGGWTASLPDGRGAFSADGLAWRPMGTG
ncbi:hypothetical protein JOF53_006791 [Crossiella equi]|uniref:Exo-alpha-sialidase n=1 Tax=Crossiella equi TaxID=130796 RepID=A0ABS5AMV6_9PSEU|nr:hypothetical protein [Crossiella equi]MBP2477919.1 hypothetical protein [Crossiella equi]